MGALIEDVLEADQSVEIGDLVKLSLFFFKSVLILKISSREKQSITGSKFETLRRRLLEYQPHFM